MPKDPANLFINTSQDPGLSYSGSSNDAYTLQYGTPDTSKTVININNYKLDSAGSNSQVMVNIDGRVNGDPEFTYNANTNVLAVRTINANNINTTFGANLGNVSNVKIAGGTSGYVLKTDGAGNLSWVSQQVASTTWSSITDKPTFDDVATTGDYNDLANKPSIPSISGLASTSYVTSEIANITYANLSGTPTLATVATSGRYIDLSNLPNLSAVALSGNYNDLANTPSIPSISGLATETYVTNQIANVTYANLSGTPTIPTHTSNIINDSGFIISTGIPVQTGNSGKFLTTDGSNTSWDTVGVGVTSYDDLTNKPTIPTKTSDITNDSNFVTLIEMQNYVNGLINIDGGNASASFTTTIDGGNA